ncbi:MAG: thiamine phosphate synthase [Planctomycetota bacterium]
MTAAADRLLLISDVARVGELPFLRAVEDATAAGLTRVLLREPDVTPPGLESLVESLVPLVGREGLGLSIHPHAASAEGRLELARREELGFLHVGRCPAAKVAEVRGARPGIRIGYSSHDIESAAQAFESGADYVTLSPVFSPSSKTIEGATLGVDSLRNAIAAVDATLGRSREVWGLGGVSEGNASEVLDAGASGVAVIGAILDADDVQAATRALLAVLGRRD